MPSLIFLASQERVEDLEIDEDPVHTFPCIHSRGFHDEARAQLYALVTGRFFDEAMELECLYRSLSDEGPTVYEFSRELVSRLAALEQDQVTEYVELWSECAEIEAMDTSRDDLNEFVFLLVNLCQAAVNEDDLGIYVYADT
ncbi:MAG: hypothetical protein WD356_11150 [Pseudomonadales bacterium]